MITPAGKSHRRQGGGGGPAGGGGRSLGVPGLADSREMPNHLRHCDVRCPVPGSGCCRRIASSVLLPSVQHRAENAVAPITGTPCVRSRHHPNPSPPPGAPTRRPSRRPAETFGLPLPPVSGSVAETHRAQIHSIVPLTPPGRTPMRKRRDAQCPRRRGRSARPRTSGIIRCKCLNRRTSFESSSRPTAVTAGWAKLPN